MPKLAVDISLYDIPQVKRTLQLSAFVVDSFASIPQEQLIHVIAASRRTLPEMCERLDTWLDSLDAITAEIDKYNKDNA